MNALETMERELKAALPGVWTRVRRAKSKTGKWFLDAKLEGHVVIVTWSPKHGLGVSASAGDEGYGEGPEEVFADAAAATRRALALLKDKTHTRPPDEVLLRELRALAGLTQVELAERLGVQQAAVSKLERRDDITLASLRRFVAALGAELEINVRTASGEVVRLLEAASPKPSRAACEHVEQRLDPVPAPETSAAAGELTKFGELVEESVRAAFESYGALLRERFDVSRAWDVHIGDPPFGNAGLAHCTADGTVSVSPSRVWEVSHGVARKLSSAQPACTRAEHVLPAAVRFLVAHEMGHFVEPSVFIGCGAVGSLVNHVVEDRELRADTIAGWLSARSGEDPFLGATLSAELGCPAARCTHPGSVARELAYVSGYAWGEQEARAREGRALENIVLYAADLDRSRAFYEGLGLLMTAERHGNGPVHYSTKLGNVLLELYPRSRGARPAATRLTIRDGGEAAFGSVTCVDPDSLRDENRSRVVTDPDGNRIEIASVSASPPIRKGTPLVAC